MRGKIVNLCLGFTNVLFGILLIIFTTFIPQDKTLLTVQEAYVVKNILTAIYVILVAIVFIDGIQYYNHRKDTVFNTGYLIGLFAMSFIFIKEPFISAFSIISGCIILWKSLKENLVEIDSTLGISVAVVLISAILITSMFSFSYQYFGNKIKNKENKEELAYKSDYFKYITELGIEEPYINVKKEGKYGYINSYGEVVIDFLYDYASPFVRIHMFDKNFEIALVCQDGSSYIILKNGRKVMSYRSESADDNYGAKIEELKDIYTNTLGQTDEMQYEIISQTEQMNKVPSYEEISSEYTYRYDYNEEYDLIVTQSSLGLGDKYELAKKDDLSVRVELNADNLQYDQHFLYLYSNGFIPYYETSKLAQGWFTSYGKKNEMKGKAQILEFIGDKMLIRNYNKNTVYFINSEGKALSEEYKDIYVCNDDRFIVKTEQGKYKIINNDYNKIWDEEYDAMNPRLILKGLYLTMNVEGEEDAISFNEYDYANMNWSLLNENGERILDHIEQIYDEYWKLPDDKKMSKKEKEQRVLTDIEDIKYEFVGDRFYSNYIKK